jgi:hypothetical protein
MNKFDNYTKKRVCLLKHNKFETLGEQAYFPAVTFDWTHEIPCSMVGFVQKR